MLITLFSPAETKNQGGTLIKSELFGAASSRNDILKTYNQLLQTKDYSVLKILFGIANEDEFQYYLRGTDTDELMHAVERYSGVAYEYLDFTSLEDDAKKYLYNNLIIFSNLYGPILAKDPVAYYKVKQGSNIGNIAPDKYYKERFTYQLDLFLQNREILDLRAGYYDKFYKITQPYTTLKFLKNDKVVSHWAKAYRGIVLREIAKHGITTLDALYALNIQGLHVREILKRNNHTEVIYDIREN